MTTSPVDAAGPKPLQGDAMSNCAAMISRAAARLPQKTALVCEQRSLTYAQLEDESGRLAHGLKRLGLGQGAILPILLRRGCNGAVALLACWKAGLAACVLDMSYPAERLADIRRQCGTDAVLDENLFARLLDSETAEPAGRLPEPAPHDLALAVFTSGSTGRPKGVLLPHRTLSLAVKNARGWIREDDVMLSTASQSFIAMMFDLVSPLAVGGTVNIASDAVRKDVNMAAEHIRRQHISVAFMAPQMAAPFLEIADGALRLLFIGSERVRRLFSSRTTIVNSYGASETGGLLASFQVDHAYDNTPIGRLYPDSSLFLLDAEERPVSEGEVGEICIQGQIAHGYLHQPELTARRFAPAPDVTGNDEPLFRTGDLGRLLPDGTLEYVQRKDWMLKIRGFRVEPGEIEAAMLHSAPLDKVVVTGFEDASGQARIYACYTAQEKIDKEKLREDLAKNLPEYMLPAFMEQVSALPLNANGKIDRTRIAPPDFALLRAEYAQPETELEKSICRAFGQVLSQDNIGLDDDFLRLGGDSVSAMRLQSLLAYPGMSAASILRERTPRALAQYLAAGPAAHASLTPAPDREEWPLTFSERQMATEQGLTPDSVAYNVNLAFLMEGPLECERLKQALAVLARTYRILRSFYPLRNGEHVRCLLPEDMAIPFELECCTEAEVPARVQQRNTPFDLAHGPLFRATVFKIGPERHILHLLFHHIIMDGLSVEPLLTTLMQAYADGILPEEAEQVRPDYLDFAVFQANEPEPAPDFFTRMFSDGVPENEMPTVPLRPETLPCPDAFASSVVSFARLEQRARMLGVTPYAVMLAALGLTLGKYCGSGDVTLGAAMNCRQMPETAAMPGMFVNILPMRLHMAADAGLHEYIRNTAELIEEVRANSGCPFSSLVPLLAPERNAARAPVFDVLVNYLEETWRPDPGVAGLRMSPFPLPLQALPMDLTLELRHCGDEVRMKLLYSTALYDREIAEGMLDHYNAVLERIIGGNDMTLADACELTDAQRRQILEDFAGRDTGPESGETTVDAFRRMARKHPQRRAAALGDDCITYADLDRLSDILARRLADRGLGRGGVAGIIVRRGLMMPVGALGVLKSGAAYLPLDPSYPTERLEYMLADSGAELLIADHDLLSKVPGFRGTVLDADEILAMRAHLPALEQGDVPPAPLPGDLLTLIYTSGTTGKPKGVMISHANLATFCNWYADRYELTPADVVSAYASFGFDACLMDMFPALSHGACIQIIPEEMRLDLPGMNACFEKYGVTLAFLTTQLGRQFAAGMSNTTLRVLSTGGETLTPLDPPENFALDNAYGPTECTIITTIFRMSRRYDRVPLGRPVDNMRLYIVDKQGRLAPVGTAGELCIAGRQVALGYLNRPDLTAEKFTPNPFDSRPGYERIYHSGDIARLLPDGNLDFMGRSDFQVKIRGFRVELTEIEGRIRQHPDVADAAVVAMDAPGGGKCAAAYVVMRAGKTLDAERLDAFIAEELPPYMIPSATTQLESIPLNPNGKVDRRKLPPPDFAASAADEPAECATQPENLLTGAVREVIASVLGHTQFSRLSNLLRAGLASLSAIRLAALLDERFGAAPAVREIMADPTLLGIENALIRSLLAKRQDAPAPEAAPKAPAGDTGPWPLAANQLGIYFDCVKRPGTLAYNVPFSLDLPVGVDAGRLAKAFKTVVDAHAALNVRVESIDGRVCAVPLSQQVTIPAIHVAKTDLMRHRAAFVRPFDLFKGPLWRAELVDSGEGLTLLWDAHHLVFDGASLDILLHSLAVCYETGSLPPKLLEKLSMREWALNEADRESGAQWQEDREWISGLFQNFEAASQIPPDLPPQEKRGELAETVQPLDGQHMERFCRANGFTPAALCLAAACYAVCRWTQGNEAWLSAVSSGRSDTRLGNTIGMFVRTVPLGIGLGTARSRMDYVRSVQDSLNEAIAHEDYPYVSVCEEYGFAPHIMYACELGVASAPQFDGRTAVMTPLAMQEPKFDLSIHVEERDGKPVFAVQYDSALYSAWLMERFADTLGMALAGILGRPDEPVRTLSLVSSHQEKLLERINDTCFPLDEMVLHRKFEAQAVRWPDRVALVADEGSYDYAALNAAANRLAHGLLALGLQPEERVAFALPRTGRILVAMLGILKAGGAYIPLDPEYPAERIAHVLEDSGARFIITDDGTGGIRPAGSATVLNFAEVGKNRPDSNPDVSVAPEQLAYLIYTSGSTGKPKGVMLRHAGICNYVTAHPRNAHVAALAQDAHTMLSVTTVAFDMFLKESMTTLCNGLTLVLANDDETRDPLRLARLFARTGADAFNATPSRLVEYAEYPPLLEALSKCRVLMAGAEKYPEALLRKLRAGSARLFNTYGPTEITVSCNCKELTDADRVTVGAPLLNAREYVVDRDGNVLPCGMIGELLVGGIGVAAGYNNLPEQTATRFITFAGQRVYRTGDYARWTENGEISILGRNDSQVKLRGLRIELGEVENVLASLPGVSACVAGIRVLNGQEHLCAWYTGEETDPQKLREQAAGTLPGYMTPTAWVHLEKMPSLPNGKTDFRNLPDPVPLASEGYVAPETETERKICAVFATVLGLERVGVTDGFFDLGGSSLAVARVLIEAERVSLPGIAYADVFAHPTPQKLAACLAARNAPAAGTAPEASPGTRHEDYAQLNSLLQENTLESFRAGQERPLGTVLLTGPAGFLGSHILHGLITQGDGAICCLMRRGRYESAEKRLKQILYYYFEDDFEQLFGKRLTVVEGDITNAADLARIAGLSDLRIDTIINCAANVSHFSQGSDITDVNLGGVRTLIDLALRLEARLVQISTASVAGFSIDGKPAPDTRLTERDFYIGQNLDNQYVRSKFLAEKAILEAASKGLDAKIMRVGNLMARNHDGEFQINLRSNSFIGRLRAWYVIGGFPYSSFLHHTELAPIDSTARAVLLLATSPRACRVFHPFNNHSLFMGDILEAMRQEGIDIPFMEDDEFAQAMAQARNDPNKAERLVTLLAYNNMADGRAAVPLAAASAYTAQALLRHGWSWPETGNTYLRNFIRALSGMGFFDM